MLRRARDASEPLRGACATRAGSKVHLQHIGRNLVPRHARLGLLDGLVKPEPVLLGDRVLYRADADVSATSID